MCYCILYKLNGGLSISKIYDIAIVGGSMSGKSTWIANFI